MQYNDAARVHAVTDAYGNTYHYDANGNMDQKVVNGQTFTMAYDSENRMVSVTGTNLSATFVYDGDGRRVKSMVNGETIFFAGGHFQLNSTTGEVTKYYGGIAVRKYIVPQSTTLTYLLGDHLGLARRGSATPPRCDRRSPRLRHQKNICGSRKTATDVFNSSPTPPSTFRRRRWRAKSPL